jgi:hypothetical protein
VAFVLVKLSLESNFFAFNHFPFPFDHLSNKARQVLPLSGAYLMTRVQSRCTWSC